MDFVVISVSFLSGGVIGSIFVRFWMNKEIEMVHNENVSLRGVVDKNRSLALDLANADEKIGCMERKLREEKDEIARLKRERQSCPKPSVSHWTERNYLAGA